MTNDNYNVAWNFWPDPPAVFKGQHIPIFTPDQQACGLGSMF